MKGRTLLKALAVAAVTLLLASLGLARQQPQEWPVALRVASGGAAGRYVSSGERGALDAGAQQITKRQVFTLVDLNGGVPSGGDKVMVRWEASLWREEGGKVVRVPAKGAPEAECTFKIQLKGKHLALVAPSGRYVAVPPDGGALTTTEKADEAALFEAVVNPTVAGPAVQTPGKPQSQLEGVLVAFRVVPAGGAARYVTMKPQGGLDASGDKITARQTFIVVDLNKGNLDDGDKVKIFYEGGSLWHEDKSAGRVHRVAARGASDAECTFRVKLHGKSVMLETASGRLVSAPADGGALVTKERPDDSTLFELVPNPTPQP
jgi:hypothetical protein